MKTTNTGNKGIYQRKSGKFEASVRFPKNREGVQHKFHVGTYNDLATAKKQREDFIMSLV
jgi:hypothetical protein